MKVTLIFLVLVFILQIVTIIFISKSSQAINHPLRTIISSLDDLKDPELIKTAMTSIGGLSMNSKQIH